MSASVTSVPKTIFRAAARSRSGGASDTGVPIMGREAVIARKLRRSSILSPLQRNGRRRTLAEQPATAKPWNKSEIAKQPVRTCTLAGSGHAGGRIYHQLQFAVGARQ